MKYGLMKLGRVLLMFVLAAILAAVVMNLWNWIMPGLYFGINTIDYWHALGLLVLSRILFGGFRGHGGWHRAHKWQHWQKWQAMSPEEREKFWQHRGGGRKPEAE
ncbi:hypothetical protein AAKU67_002770 [Oxalobacteraceae bacterium GrIS 2.11]